jgi:hypothetical protein
METLRNLKKFMTDSYWLGEPPWFPKDMPDLKGKVVIVTGGNSGLGRDTVKVSSLNLLSWRSRHLIVPVVSFGQRSARLYGMSQ